jgi:hypothetical protein
MWRRCVSASPVGYLRGICHSAPIFPLAPFHAGNFSLKRGLKKRPDRGSNGF